jgi:hypothetical protein
MAATPLRVVQSRTPPEDPEAERAAINWLDNAPTAYLLCRHRHAHPKLQPDPKTGKLPKGTRVYAVGPDLHEVHMPCRDCGLPKVQVIRGGDPTAVVDSWLDYKAVPGYLKPKGSSRYVNNDDCRKAAARRGNLKAALVAAAKKPLGA